MNKTIRFTKSDKPYEKRIALLPNDIAHIKQKSMLYFETGYGIDYGISDEEYIQAGVHIA